MYGLEYTTKFFPRQHGATRKTDTQLIEDLVILCNLQIKCKIGTLYWITKLFIVYVYILFRSVVFGFYYQCSLTIN